MEVNSEACFQNENFTWKNRVDGEASVSNPQPKLKSFQFQKSEDRTEVPQLF